jgi:hypothetical protein
MDAACNTVPIKQAASEVRPKLAEKRQFPLTGKSGILEFDSR